MDFFTLKTTSDKRIVGPAYPQIQKVAGSIDKLAHDSIYSVYSDAFPEFTPNLDYLVLGKNSVLTDFLSSSMIDSGFIVNSKVKQILENFRLPPYKFYPARIEHNGIYYDNYYWVFYVSNVLDYIDYSRTKFYIADFFGNKESVGFYINNGSMLSNKIEQLPDDKKLDTEYIYINNHFPYVDLFKFSGVNFNTYVSEKISNAFYDQNVSGYETVKSKKIITAF